MKLTWKDEGRVLHFEAETDADVAMVGMLADRGAQSRERWPHVGLFRGAQMHTRPCPPDEFARLSAMGEDPCWFFWKPNGGVCEVLCGFDLELARVTYARGTLPTPEMQLRASAAARIGNGILDGIQLMRAEGNAHGDGGAVG